VGRNLLLVGQNHLVLVDRNLPFPCNHPVEAYHPFLWNLQNFLNIVYSMRGQLMDLGSARYTVLEAEAWGFHIDL
jgi:hypothetical protein